MATRNGSAEWKGDLKGGSGELTVGDGVFSGAYSFASRFEDGAGTNPEELLAAGHAACFSMALSALLATEDKTADSIRTTAKVHLRQADGLPTITQIDLDVEGAVPELDEDGFVAFAEKAKDGCVVSRALAGVKEINLNARLAS